MSLFTIFCFFVTFCFSAGLDCVWNRDTNFPMYPSLLMDLASWKSILPTMEGNTRVIRIATGATVLVACPQTTITAFPTKVVVKGTCKGGSYLNVGGKNYNMMQLGCASRVKEDISMTNTPCGSQGDSSATDFNIIGYDIPGYGFYNLIGVCFNHTLESAIFTKHLLRGKSVNASDGNPTRPAFKTDTGFFTVSANTCYDQDSQVQLMANLLGNSSVIDVSNSLYFSRGHLSPDADFLSEMEADATYYYINAIPQWQSINNGNWRYLEAAVRSLAATYSGRDFTIWTGTWGILKLDDINKNEVQIYLGLTKGKNVIPAPELTWKVVYENATNQGVALISSNNPYLTSSPNTLCPDICSLIHWITISVNNPTRGFVYCCTVQSLRTAVPSAPDLGNAGLLTS